MQELSFFLVQSNGNQKNIGREIKSLELESPYNYLYLLVLVVRTHLEFSYLTRDYLQQMYIVYKGWNAFVAAGVHAIKR